MPDILSEHPVSLDSYQAFVLEERAAEAIIDGDRWNEDRADLINKEAKEFMGQHGPGGVLLVPQIYSDKLSGFTQEYPDITNDMADELSDLLWYSFDVAVHNNIDPGAASAHAIEAHTGESQEAPTSFESMQQQIMERADAIKFNVASDSPYEISVVDSPLQAFAIAHLNLMTALQTNTDSPVTEINAEGSKDVPLDVAIGEYINILAYIAKDRLNWDVKEIARYSAFKLRQRKKYGKQIGNLFSEFTTQVIGTDSEGSSDQKIDSQTEAS